MTRALHAQVAHFRSHDKSVPSSLYCTWANTTIHHNVALIEADQTKAAGTANAEHVSNPLDRYNVFGCGFGPFFLVPSFADCSMLALLFNRMPRPTSKARVTQSSCVSSVDGSLAQHISLAPSGNIGCHTCLHIIARLVACPESAILVIARLPGLRCR